MTTLYNKAILPIEPITAAAFDIGALAAWLAHQSDITQATFFNEFDTQLRKACDTTKGSLGISMQCIYINKHLNCDAARTLVEIGTWE